MNSLLLNELVLILTDKFTQLLNEPFVRVDSRLFDEVDSRKMTMNQKFQFWNDKMWTVNFIQNLS